MFLVTVAYRPWPPRPSTEPTGRNGHAVHRSGRARARLARQARRSMAVVPSSSPRLFRGDQNDAAGHRARMARTDLHRGTTQRMALSGAAHQAHACHAREGTSTITALVDLRIVGASCQHDGGRARAWLARPRATQTWWLSSAECRLGSGIGPGATAGRQPVPTRARRADRVSFL